MTLVGVCFMKQLLMIKKKNSSDRRNADVNVCKRSHFSRGILKSTLTFRLRGHVFPSPKEYNPFLKIQTISIISKPLSPHVWFVLKASSWLGRAWSLESLSTPFNAFLSTYVSVVILGTLGLLLFSWVFVRLLSPRHREFLQNPIDGPSRSV